MTNDISTLHREDLDTLWNIKVFFFICNSLFWRVLLNRTHPCQFPCHLGISPENKNRPMQWQWIDIVPIQSAVQRLAYTSAINMHMNIVQSPSCFFGNLESPLSPWQWLASLHPESKHTCIRDSRKLILRNRTFAQWVPKQCSRHH